MDEVPVVTVFLRHQGDVLLLRRSAEVGSYPGRWGAVAGHVSDDDPLASALAEIEEETGLRNSDVTLVKNGPSFPVEDDERDTQWIVHPFLFDTDIREIRTNWETEETEWTSPTVLLRRDTVPELWTSYRRVAPSVVELTDDTIHGSTHLSIRALEVLRDRAAQLATTDAVDGEQVRARLLETAHRLLDARPSMAALANRVHRTLYASQPELDASAVETNAHEAIHRTRDVEAEVATQAATLLDEKQILTLSRSGTVLRALRQGNPTSVAVATSHPGGEGIGVAERLADNHDVTLFPDSAVADLLASGEIDLVLVGADTVYPSGAVVNKVGTRNAALAAHHEDVPFFVACSVDKVAVERTPPRETTDRQAVYDGPVPFQVRAPRFDTTPSTLVSGSFVTERGTIAPEDIEAIAGEMEQFRDWT